MNWPWLDSAAFAAMPKKAARQAPTDGDKLAAAASPTDEEESRPSNPSAVSPRKSSPSKKKGKKRK
jgi:hypothetical protein